jgi:hypothetical protein
MGVVPKKAVQALAIALLKLVRDHAKLGSGVVACRSLLDMNKYRNGSKLHANEISNEAFVTELIKSVKCTVARPQIAKNWL